MHLTDLTVLWATLAQPIVAALRHFIEQYECRVLVLDILHTRHSGLLANISTIHSYDTYLPVTPLTSQVHQPVTNPVSYRRNR